MNTNNVMKAIAALDLEPVKTKLMHVASGEGWSRARVDALDVEYRRFLYLSHAFPDEAAAPSVDVDTFWHYHILDTVKYAADCASAFGYFLHHNPNVGLDSAPEAGDEERGGRRMRAMYEHTFGIAYGVAESEAAGGDGIDAQRRADYQAAYCNVPVSASSIDAQGGAGRQAAYCNVPVNASSIDAQGGAGRQAAYCNVPVSASSIDAQRGAGHQAAYCNVPVNVRCIDAQRRAGHQAAYCNTGHQAAYCNSPVHANSTEALAA